MRRAFMSITLLVLFTFYSDGAADGDLLPQLDGLTEKMCIFANFLDELEQ